MSRPGTTAESTVEMTRQMGWRAKRRRASGTLGVTTVRRQGQDRADTPESYFLSIWGSSGGDRHSAMKLARHRTYRSEGVDVTDAGSPIFARQSRYHSEMEDLFAARAGCRRCCERWEAWVERDANSAEVTRMSSNAGQADHRRAGAKTMRRRAGPTPSRAAAGNEVSGKDYNDPALIGPTRTTVLTAAGPVERRASGMNVCGMGRVAVARRPSGR